MIQRIIIESSNGKTVSNDKLSPVITENQLRKTLGQHHTIISCHVDKFGVALVVLDGRI